VVELGRVDAESAGYQLPMGLSDLSGSNAPPPPRSYHASKMVVTQSQWTLYLSLNGGNSHTVCTVYTHTEYTVYLWRYVRRMHGT
jgi:hypothetical protein